MPGANDLCRLRIDGDTQLPHASTRRRQRAEATSGCRPTGTQRAVLVPGLSAQPSRKQG